MSQRSLILIAALLVPNACAKQIPQELRVARASYERAAADPSTRQETPAELDEARRSLTRAERSYVVEGDTPKTRDRAYIATRKAELAMVMARAADQVEAARNAELWRAREALAAEQAENAANASRLATEQELRAEAERRAAMAITALAEIAAVRNEARGTVVTLSGSVLFASGKSELLPSATSRLTQVAEALVAADPGATFVVEGYTDSKGSAAFNEKLSEARAQAVRDFLVAHGVPAERIEARGLGESQPVATNATAEGRANNRRVEIIIQPPR
ncbi:Outer membrane protein OmpA [Nannocystis exedens]|uniref:Outer membrane protein OmpA n=1 Tax=Nannocystis exedens TaxID=54 RepID=A0A1I2HCU8_9BACT|nr:OmpA family protein [Nannocystis exedens]PCC70063.1 Peptidoglycan-binding protein ArfA [Nannocystis exedens]SFF26777.1 Outer membrane protein OmpA [Nannocystis exedens]